MDREQRYKENPSSNKTKHCHLKNLATIVNIYNISQVSLLLVTTEFQLFQQKKKKIEMQQVVLCHLYLVGLQMKQCIFKNIFIHEPLENVQAV